MSDENINSFMARMDERLGRIEKAMEERLDRIEEDLQKLKHVILEGNGSPAITVQVATIDQRVKQLEASENEKKVPRHVAIGIWVSLVLGIAGIMAGFTN